MHDGQMQWSCSIGTRVSHIYTNTSRREQQRNNLVISNAGGNVQWSVAVVSSMVHIHRITTYYLHTAVV